MESKNKLEGKTTSLFFKLSGDWNKQSSALRTKYPMLTSEDVKFENGKETDLFKRLENRLGKSRDEVINILKTNEKACC
ncbi:hypothetical protein [Mariniflexile sp. HMF6888]|uniref:hypothetical protein n=1 Tax=Mariniflexile sp. HMF6888 TaxID=3373086 RepID=UPI0037B6609A